MGKDMTYAGGSPESKVASALAFRGPSLRFAPVPCLLSRVRALLGARREFC